MKKFVCDYPWTHLEVNNPNGDVTACCDNNTVLGNVNESTVDEIWNGEGYRTMRRRMREEGAHALCPYTCPVLVGGKRYKDLEWYRDLDPETPAHANAARNREEFEAGDLTLASHPRWIRFAYSWLCNLDCYHCYQRDEALVANKLPDGFMEDLYRLAPMAQVILPFGGEPFLYKPVLDLLETVSMSPGARFHFITNGTLLNDRIMQLLEERTIGHMSVSLDAATEPSFDLLRVRGRNASWSEVMETLGRLAELRRRKGFSFSVSMTVNTVNFDEIERFVDIGLTHDAQPLILLVANPDQTADFQRQYLRFTDAQFDTMFEQIDRCLPKVRERGWEDSETALTLLRRHLRQHRQEENSLTVFTAKNAARKVARRLPEHWQSSLRGAIARARARRA